jgi:hypothetical protein
MREGRIAEWILSLVSAPDRAASTVGDLLEDAVTRGWFWFWMCIARTTVSFLGQGLTAAPLPMAAGAVFLWFVYVLLSVILTSCGNVLASLLWGIAYFLTHHTTQEILADLVRIRLPWPAPPPWVTQWIGVLLPWVVVPFQMGRLAARQWPGRELAVGIAMMILWTPLAILTKVHVPLFPVVQTSVLLGALWVRRQSLRITQASLS